MKQKSLSKWLKFIIIGIGICGLIIYAFVIPMMGNMISMMGKGEFDNYFWPWLIFIWATGIPCYVSLVFAWKIASNIGADQSFSIPNSKLFQWISILAAVDSAFFFIGNIVFLFLNMNHPSIVLFSFIIVFIGVAIAIASAVLSHLVMKAAILQNESDLTI